MILVFFLLTLFIFNSKTYLLLFILFAFINFFILKRSLLHTLFLTFLLALPFENRIREWILTVTPQLFPHVSNSGYFFHFGLTPRLIILSTLLLIIPFTPRFNTHLKWTFSHFFLLLFLFFLALNTLFFYPLDGITFSGLIRLIEFVAIFFVGQYFFAHPRFRHLFLPYIYSLLIFSTIFGGVQLLIQHPLGRYIEQTNPSIPLGYNTTDGSSRYRLAAFISHPVYFGSFMSILMPIVLGFAISSQSTLAFVFVLASCVVTLGTYSRSAWLTLPLGLSLLIPHLRRIKFIATKYLLIICTLALILSGIIIISRLNSLSSLFSPNGNGTIRLELIKQSFTMIKNYPLSGVGPNRFTDELIRQNIPENIFGFIVVVHNTFFIFLTELGIPAGLCFIFFVLFTLTGSFSKTKTPLLRGVWLGAATFIISAQFHPLFLFDPTLCLFMLTLSYLSTC